MIDYAIRIEAPAEAIFEMLTDPDMLTEWMAREAQVEQRPGGAFRWIYDNGDVVAGHIVALEPPRRLVLAYGWEIPVARAIPPGSTEVEITIEELPDGSGCLLRLVHRALPAAELDSHRGGWEYFLGRLAARLSDGPQAHEGDQGG